MSPTFQKIFTVGSWSSVLKFPVFLGDENRTATCFLETPRRVAAALHEACWLAWWPHLCLVVSSGCLEVARPEMQATCAKAVFFLGRNGPLNFWKP